MKNIHVKHHAECCQAIFTAEDCGKNITKHAKDAKNKQAMEAPSGLAPSFHNQILAAIV